METRTLTGYAAWASHLVNGDPSGLSEEEFAELQTWLSWHGLYDYDCLSVEEGDSFFACPTGMNVRGDCVKFVFVDDR